MAGQPNVIWITLESTRADHTSMGGHDRDTTPNLQRIADRSSSRYYRNCFSHGIWTLASSASILTGTRPTRHGALTVGGAIPSDLATVPELLRSAGYDTACFSPNAYLSSATGLDRGFDDFTWIGKSTLPGAVGLPTLLKYLARIRRHGGGLTTDTRKHGTGYMMTESIKRWLGSKDRDSDPFFLYAHYGDPHHPYHPPLPYFRDYAEDLEVPAERASELALDHHANRHELIANGCDLAAEEWEALKALYDAEIEYTDALVGQLFDYAQSLGLDDTVFVVTADHGELFGEHGLVGHIVSVDDAVSHVPLVVHGLDCALDYEGDLVQPADVVRTLLSVCGADADHLHGKDMRREERRYAVVHRGGERCRKNLDKIENHSSAFDAARYPSESVTAIRDGDFKYVSGAETSRLYRLPDENRDRSEEHPDVVDRFDPALADRVASDEAAVGTSRGQGAFTDDMRDQLADLGYLVE